MKSGSSKKELKSVCGIPYTPQHIGQLEAAGKFPKRVNLGSGRMGAVRGGGVGGVCIRGDETAGTLPLGNRVRKFL